jgi:hypothetical protein
MNEGNRRISTMKKEGRTTEDRNKLKRATDNAKKEYLESICDEIIEFQRTGRYHLMYMKTKELGWKENHGIQNIGIEDCRGNIIIDQTSIANLGEVYHRALRSS